MRHQRPSSAKRGAVSFHTFGSSTFGAWGGGGVAQAARSNASTSALRIALLLRLSERRIGALFVGCMVEAVLGLAVHHAARMPDLLADFRGAARFAQPARGEQLEEHRHEEDGEEGRG